MKYKVLFIMLMLFPLFSFAQGFNDEKTSLSNFIKRMYTIAPFEGVKIVDDYDHQYLISVVGLEKAV